MPRISHQVFDSKGPKRGLLQRAAQAVGWSDGANGSAQAPEEAPASTPAVFQAEPPPNGTDEPPAASPSSSPAECPEDFPPLTLIKIGDTVQIDSSPDEKDEWTSEDFARLFLIWLTH